MDSSDQKIEVGMVLKNHASIRYKITRIGEHQDQMCAYGSLVREDGTLREEEAFGHLSKDGKPIAWGSGWDIVELPKPTTQTNMKEDDNYKVFNFFRTSSHPENCPKCGAPRPCYYHP